MKICTGKGDGGFSSLSDGKLLPKDSFCFEVLGIIDQLSAVLGMAKAAGGDRDFLENAQKTLIKIMSYISCKEEKYMLTDAEADIPLAHQSCQLNCFVLAGETELSSRLDFARTLCRKAERKYVTYCRTEKGDKNAVVFLNRLSDALFIAARMADNP